MSMALKCKLQIVTSPISIVRKIDKMEKWDIAHQIQVPKFSCLEYFAPFVFSREK